MRVKLADVPLEIRRRAARHLEAIRGTPLTQGGDAARLGDEACPVYRPDVKGIAYWELEVAGVKTVGREGPDGRPRRGSSGFVLLSTGPHDVPIPHWSLELEPPSRELETRSKQGQVARVVKLDTLAYLAEDAKGAYLAHLGQFPPLLTRVPGKLPVERALSSLESHPAAASKSDGRQVGKHKVTRTGARAWKPSVAPWKSWAQAKKRYASTYKLHLSALRAHAARAWHLEGLLAKFGEGIHEGDRLIVPLLKPGKAEVTGDGAAAVKMAVLDRNPPAVELLAGGAEKRAEQEFQLRLTYQDGSVETLTFFVVPRGTPSNRRGVPDPVQVLPPR